MMDRLEARLERGLDRFFDWIGDHPLTIFLGLALIGGLSALVESFT